MFKGIGMDHQIEDRGGEGKGIKVSVDLLFARIFDVWVIYHPRDLKTFIVDVFNRTLQVSHKRKSMVRVTFIRDNFQGDIHEKQSLVFQAALTESQDNLLYRIIRPSQSIEPFIRRPPFAVIVHEMLIMLLHPLFSKQEWSVRGR